MDPTLRARTVLFASAMTALMFGLTVIEKGATVDLGTSGFAALALLAGGLFLERVAVSAYRGTLVRGDAAIAGVLFGLPLSFFMVQTRAAMASGNAPLATGAERVVGTVGVVLVVAAAIGAWRRRKAQRM
jgi:hypothetical protein